MTESLTQVIDRVLEQLAGYNAQATNLHGATVYESIHRSNRFDANAKQILALANLQAAIIKRQHDLLRLAKEALEAAAGETYNAIIRTADKDRIIGILEMALAAIEAAEQEGV